MCVLSTTTDNLSKLTDFVYTSKYLANTVRILQTLKCPDWRVLYVVLQVIVNAISRTLSTFYC